MSSSSSSSKIGQCAICLSSLTSRNTFAITKCGHTFHQECINQWIKSNKNCPTCRTKASESNLIKLFIQEHEDDDTAAAVKEKESKIRKEKRIESVHSSPCRKAVKKCECQFIRYKNGDLEYQSCPVFCVTINYEKSNGIIKVILSDGYIITTSPSKELEIFNEKTKDRKYIDSGGHEHFNSSRTRKTDVPYIVRSTDYGNQINFYYPEFIVTRDENDGRVDVNISSLADSNEWFKIVICPQHEVFYVKHDDHNHRRTFSDKPCVHLKI